GQGPFRWVALSGDPQDILTTDRALLDAFPQKAHLRRWLTMAQKRVKFQGLPARICWLGYGERAKAGLIFNELVASGKVKAPIVGPQAAEDDAPLAVVEDGAVACDGDRITWVGRTSAAPRGGERIDAQGALLAPGLIDPHTHLIFAGDRAREHARRLAGATYLQIAQAGGGIRSTVESTRAASDE